MILLTIPASIYNHSLPGALTEEAPCSSLLQPLPQMMWACMCDVGFRVD